MKKLYSGKTKDVYQIDENCNQLFFKDDVTGENGQFDPGANSVGLTIEGAGFYGLAMSEYFFKLFIANGIKTHFISADLAKRTMNVLPVSPFGTGIEVICRYVATGSFIRRYGGYIQDGTKLDGFVEVSLKDDARGDPFISEELLMLFDILEPGDYAYIQSETRKIAQIIREELAKKGIELYDLKLEFGRTRKGDIVLIDEISGGNMRAYREGQSLGPIELSKVFYN